MGRSFTAATRHGKKLLFGHRLSGLFLFVGVRVYLTEFLLLASIIFSPIVEFDTERRYLWNEVLPNVQHHCLQHGLDVMFVDPLLGNTEDPTLDPDNLEVRLKELTNCSDESIGPFFLVEYTSFLFFISSEKTMKRSPGSAAIKDCSLPLAQKVDRQADSKLPRSKMSRLMTKPTK